MTYPTRLALWASLFAVQLEFGICNAQVQAPHTIALLEAVRGTLVNNVSVRLQERQVDFAKGALEQASSQFDPVFGASAGLARDKTPLNSQQQLQSPVDSVRTDTATYGLSLSRQLRNGTVLETTVSTSRSEDTVGELSGLQAQNLGRLNFSVRVPLGKGSGPTVAAGEAATAREADATRNDLQHTLAQSVMDTVSAYWNLVAAGKNLTIAREAEASLVRLGEELEKLIVADERPAAELTLINASLTGKTSQRIGAERALLDAQQALGRLIGQPYNVYSRLQAATDFPSSPAIEVRDAAETGRLLEYALRHRADLAAAYLRHSAAQILTDAARYNLKPQLDLKFNLGYVSLDESNAWRGTLWPYSRTPVGPSGGVTLTYQWPLSNRSARAGLTQQIALLDQSEARVADLTNAVGAGVEAALNGAMSSARQLRQSVGSLDLYSRATDNERTKHRLGQSTLVDVLSVNDMLLAARAAHVSYQVSYLSFLVRLRFETATLVESSAHGQSITLEQLLTPPTAAKE
ncbi:MAG: TolC family protein [Pseudomonadota bacterium]